MTNPTVEFFYPTDLEKDTVLIDLEGIVTAENCEYLLQIETYGKRIYAQEQLGLMLSTYKPMSKEPLAHQCLEKLSLE